ncbi:flippase [soil metagenome]
MQIIKEINEKLFSKTGKKVAGNIGWLTIERGVRLGFGLVVGILVARYLGPSDYGKLNYVITFALIIEAISSLGLDNIIIKKIVALKDRQFEIVNTSLTLRLISSIILIPVGILLIHLLRDDYAINLLAYIILSSVVFRSIDVTDYWFQSYINSKYVVYSKIISFTFYGFIRLLFIYLGSTVISFGVAFLLEGIIRSLILGWFYVKKSGSLFGIRIDWKLSKLLLKESWPLLFSAITVMIYMKIDIVMLGSMSTDNEVGLYTAAVKLSELWYNIPVIITATLFPLILKYRKESTQLFNERMQMLYDIMFISMLCVSIIIFFTTDQIISLLFGLEYLPASNMLAIHVWSTIFITFSVIRGKWLIANNLEIYTAITQGLGAITNVILNIILIPKWQGIGASIATLISYFIATTVASCLFKNLREEFKLQIRSYFPYIRIYKYLKHPK